MPPVLHSKIIGKGAPLIILHGLLGMGDNWISHARWLADKGFQVHLVDQRNHGRSFHSDEMNYEVMVEDLEAYLREHDLKKIHLMGHSMGGKTAMFFAMKNPEWIKKLIIVDISPKKYPPHHHFLFEAIESLSLNTDSRKELEKQLMRKIQSISIIQFVLKNIYRSKDQKFEWRPNIYVLKNALEDLGEALPPMSIYNDSVLFIKGEKSPYIAEEDYPLIKAHFPHSEIITIPGAGHWVHAEKPERFRNEISNFLLTS